MERQSKGHAIMVSVPYQGHINPYTNLALKLASKGFTVTFAHLEYVHDKMSKARHRSNTFNGDQVVDYDFFSEARGSGLDIRYTTISDGFPLEFDREHHLEEYWGSLLRDFPSRVDEFVGKTIRSEPLLAPFLVTDTVYPWSANIAHKYDVVNVSFWTQPALVYSLLYHWDLLTEKGDFPCNGQTDEIDYIPGIKSIRTKDLMSVIKDYPKVSNVIYEAVSTSFVQVKKADFIIHNTVEELESNVLSSLNKYQPNYAIGPINFSKDLPTAAVGKSLWSESDCTNWLESKSFGSVLYVSFGSFVHTSKQIIEELAYGLMLSEVNFIWAIRPGILVSSGDSNVLPVGFEDGVKDKGLIVPWCDQIQVLSNPAVGGFLTHNGWNSTVESMWCGVPMICYPLDYDQITNRKLVVDDWKMGISLCDGDYVDRTEVAKKLKSFMSGDGFSKGLRVNANKVKDIIRNATEIEGSLEKSFDQFIEDLEAKLHVKTTTFAIKQQHP